MDSSKDDPRAKQLSTGKKKFNIDPDKVSQMFVFCCTWLCLQNEYPTFAISTTTIPYHLEVHCCTCMALNSPYGFLPID